MKILILETSTERACLVLAENDRPIASKPLLGGPELSRSLALEVKNLLSSHACKAALHLVAVGTGPGSYTGIRVGAALGKALAYGLQIPLLGFCSLSSFNQGPVLIDARSAGVYALVDGKPSLLPHSDPFLQTLPFFVSPHPHLILKRLSFQGGAPLEVAPDPEVLASLVYDQFLKEGPLPFELSYPRLSR